MFSRAKPRDLRRPSPKHTQDPSSRPEHPTLSFRRKPGPRGRARQPPFAPSRPSPMSSQAKPGDPKHLTVYQPQPTGNPATSPPPSSPTQSGDPWLGTGMGTPCIHKTQPAVSTPIFTTYITSQYRFVTQLDLRRTPVPIVPFGTARTASQSLPKGLFEPATDHASAPRSSPPSSPNSSIPSQTACRTTKVSNGSPASSQNLQTSPVL